MRFTTNLMLCGLALSGLLVSQVVDGQSTPAAPAAKASTMAKPVTVTGCLASGSGSTAGTTQAMDGRASFVLTDVDAKTAGTASFGLVADAGLHLENHVNHKVQITGTLSAPVNAGATTPPNVVNPSTPEAQSTAPKAGETPVTGAPMMPTLRVRKIKMVAESCS